MIENPSPYEPRSPRGFVFYGECMAYKYIENQDDINEFVTYIQRSGGRVQKILALRQGFQFDIIGPSTSTDGWGKRALNSFLSGNKDKFNDTD